MALQGYFTQKFDVIQVSESHDLIGSSSKSHFSESVQSLLARLIAQGS